MTQEQGWGRQHPPFGQPFYQRLRTKDPDGARVIELVAQSAGVTVDQILDRGRPHEVALARQIAMYLIHVILQRPIIDAAKVLGRQRQTASYACARIEDMREVPSFDAWITQLEGEISATEPEICRAAG